jgi:ElaA protein
MNDMILQLKSFGELTLSELHELMRLRVDVFVVEQQCPYAEIDGLDPTAWHMLGCDARGVLVAYARILPPATDGLPHIGRVVVHPAQRGNGLSKRVMQACIDAVSERYGSRANALSAQAHLTGFYEGLGYRSTSPIYDWDGIPHVDMVLNG